MDIKTAIRHMTQRLDLDTETMISLMHEIMTGQCTDAQVGAFLVALQMKGIRPSELLGGAQVMRDLAASVVLDSDEYLVDTCGTGGTGANTFNISTASAMVAAVAGARVAKHGNRGATSSSGSADVLETAGVNLALTPEQVARCIETVGVGFMYAPAHHSAMKHVIGPRKEIGVRTIFNLLGPLTNPASAPNQVLGVYDSIWIEPMLEVLRALGSRHVLVVSAEDGLDEISISAPTEIGELRDGQIQHYHIRPADFDMEQRKDFTMLQVQSARDSLEMLKRALRYEDEAAADIVALNAGAAIHVCGLETELAGGVRRAQKILREGSALDKLQELSDFTASQR